MMGLLSRARFSVLCVSLGFLLVPAALSQQPDGRLEGIFKDWRNRQERIKSIRYVVRGEKVVPKGSVLDPSTFKPVTPEKPDRDLSCKLHWTLLLDLVAQRHRIEIDEQYYNNLDDRIHARAFTRVYDGNVVKGYRPREKNTGTGIAISETSANMSVGTGDYTYLSFERNHHPFFYGHGIVALLSDHIVPGKLKTMPDKDLFLVHGQGMHEGRPCLVLRTNPIGSGAFEEFWVDTAWESAIVRRTTFKKGSQVHTDCHIKYQKTSHGWLPHQWIFTLRDTRRGATMYEERLHLDELKLDIDMRDGDFDIDVPAGTLNQQTHFSRPASKTVLERPKMESTLHKLREDGKWEEVIKEGDKIKRRWPISAWWALCLVPIGLVSLAIAYKRKDRQ